MNSVKAAKKSIKENEERLEFLCNEEEAYRRWIVDIERDIEKTKKALETFEKNLQQRNNDLEEIKSEKVAIRIENLELKLLIAESSGLNMLD